VPVKALFDASADGGPAEEDLRPWLVTVAETAVPRGVQTPMGTIE
jgi:hypothetical protein